MRGNWSWLLWRLALGLALLTIASLLGRLDWRFELLSHFRLHFLAAAGLLLLAAAPARSPRLMASLVLVVLLNLGQVAARWDGLDMAARAEGAHGQALSLVSYNMSLSARDPQRLEAWLERDPPDLLVLAEVNESALSALDELKSNYPYRAKARGQWEWLVLLSRYPLSNRQSSAIDGQPLIYARMETPGGPIGVFGIHSHAPLSGRWADARDRYLSTIAERSARHHGPVLVAGDFNLTPWSPAWLDFAGVSGLHAPSIRSGTFPSALGAAGLPIDHVFVGQGAKLETVRSGPALGSDHLPIMAKIRAPERHLR